MKLTQNVVSMCAVGCAIGTLSGASLVAQAGGVNWLNPADGVWALGTNWDSGVVPTSVDDVSLGLVGAYRVSLVGNRSAGTLSVVNSDVELAIENASALTVFGDLFNDGLVHVNPLGGGSTTTLAFNVDSMVSGSGEIRLGSTLSRARIVTNSGAVFTNGVNHLIRGVGQIDGRMANEGTVRSESGEFRLLTLEKTNTGLIEAIGPGVVFLSNVTVTQGASGLIRAQGAGGQIQLGSATIIGGDLEGAVGADVSVDSSSTLDGVRFTGDMEIQNARVLTIRNSFENNGTIDVNPLGGGSTTSMFFADTMTLEGDGEIELSAGSSRARIQTAVGAVLTANPLMTVRGTGRIEAEYVNNGLVSSNELGEFELTVNDKVNNAVMEAIGGSSLRIQNIAITQSPTAEIRALGSLSEIRLLTATIVGGNLVSKGLGKTIVTSSSVLDGVDHRGEIDVVNGRVLTLRNSFTNSGFVTVNPVGGGSATSVFVEDTMAISGGGTIVLNAPESRARIQTDVGAVLTLAADQTIRGLGRIEADLINNGLIRSDAGSEIVFSIEPKVNNSIIEAVGGSAVRFSNIAVTQGASGEIRADGASSLVIFTGTGLVGGELVTTGTSRMEMRSGSSLDDVNSMAMIEIPNGSTMQVFDGTLNNGVIDVNPLAGGSTTSLQINEDMSLGGTGTITLRTTATRARILGVDVETTLGLGAGQRLEGVGRIEVNLTNNGVIAPGLDGVGEMTATRSIVLSGGSAFEVEVNPGGADLLDSSSTIVVGGTLDVSYVEGFAPVGYWARTIMEGSDISGSFDVVNVPAPAAGLVTKVVNTGTELLVGQTCKSDQNLDGALDFFDISSFLSAYSAEDPSADFNGDGDFDFFDISGFLSSFSGSCSGF